ncbi:hypothetical protein DFH06DRAFT_1427180 [Mycena polygramma]|nr:hypothetical protein DFH06DRAFT_1427180 [Mycena polygramma]
MISATEERLAEHCDGKRPSCTQCATNSSEPCVYLPQDTDASATGKKKSDHPQASGSKARSQSHRVNPYPRHPSDRNVGPYPPSTSGHRRPSAGSGPDQYPSNPYYASGSRQGTNTTPHTTPYSTPSTTQYTSPYTAGSQYLMPTTQLAGYGGTNPSMIPPPPVGYGGGSGPFPQYSPASAQTPGSTQPHALRAPRQASRSPEFVCICGNYPRNPNACFCNQDAYDVGPYIAEKERERRERERGHE